MLNSIATFFARIFQSMGRGLRLALEAVLWPFRRIGDWLAGRGGIVKILLAGVLVLFVFLYGYFFWNTQRWKNFDPDYAALYEETAAKPSTEAPAPSGGIVSTEEEAAADAVQTCRRSLIVDVTADLVDFNVNQNAWISSMLLYKLGLFGIAWTAHPTSTTRPPSSAASIRPSGAPPSSLSIRWGGCAAPRASIPICRKRAAICNSTRRPGISP
jgi:hypothetical protein